MSPAAAAGESHSWAGQACISSVLMMGALRGRTFRLTDAGQMVSDSQLRSDSGFACSPVCWADPARSPGASCRDGFRIQNLVKPFMLSYPPVAIFQSEQNALTLCKPSSDDHRLSCKWTRLNLQSLTNSLKLWIPFLQNCCVWIVLGARHSINLPNIAHHWWRASDVQHETRTESRRPVHVPCSAVVLPC